MINRFVITACHTFGRVADKQTSEDSFQYIVMKQVRDLSCAGYPPEPVGLTWDAV